MGLISSIFSLKHVSTCKSDEYNKELMLENHFQVMDEVIKSEVNKWIALQNVKTESQDFFFYILKKSNDMFIKPYRSPLIEPSANMGKIYYQKGEKVAIGYSLEDWITMSKEFLPEYNSRIGTIGQLFILYAYRAAKNYWKLENICDNSSGLGNFWDSPKALHSFEVSGKRLTAGYYDGIGNTSKMCRYDNYVYAICGGHAGKSGIEWPVAGHIDFSKDLKKVYSYASAFIVCD